MERNRWYSNFGPLVEAFESELETFVPNVNSEAGSHTAVTFSSATLALQAILSVLDLGRGARILIPALTFPGTASAVINAGMKPVLADVDEASWTLTPQIARRFAMSGEIDAVLPVAVYGKPIDPKEWDSFSKETQLPVVIDAAAALGQQRGGEVIHTVFSMHATKPLGIGEGGLLITPSSSIASSARSWSNFGFADVGGVVSRIGTNAKMGEYYGAVGLCQIRRWDSLRQTRRTILQSYIDRLRSLSHVVTLQDGIGEFVPATLVVKIRGGVKAVANRLKEQKVQSRFWYLPPLYDHPALLRYIDQKNIRNQFPVIEDLKMSLIGLPFHTSLTTADIKLVVSTIQTAIAEE